MATQLLETDGISNVLLADLDTSVLLSNSQLQNVIEDGKLILMDLDVSLEEGAMAIAAKAQQLTTNKLAGAVFLTGPSPLYPVCIPLIFRRIISILVDVEILG
jgi:hypothetical protein